MTRVLSFILALSLAGCAPPTLDTVQPNAVAKTAFEGEWFWRDTVSEVPFGSAVTFAGAQTEMDRIRWKVEENVLLGYRAYENISDADAPSDVDVQDGVYYGAPVLAYGISKHFDIRRGYNRSTGEETNVIEENTERPWYEREYMRVDWSSNLAEAGFTFAGVPMKVMQFFDSNPDGSGAPQFDDSDGDGIIDSILLTTRVLAEPDSMFLPGYGDVPVCLFYGKAQYECAASEVSILSSLRRVDEDHDYVGTVYDDHWMETFGFFETERMAYDRNYGLAEPNREFWINRHNLWETSFERDSRGDVLCKSGDDRAPCWMFHSEDNPKPIELPYSEREVRPIVYHAGPNFDPSLIPAMHEVAEMWNKPFAETVNGLRFWECLDDGGKRKDCREQVDEDLEVFVFCPNNPSKRKDPEICSTDHTGPQGRPDGKPDLAVAGDLRYHFVDLIDNPHISSPFGYGPSAADPSGATVQIADGVVNTGSGEIISANAFLYDYVLDRIATSTADLVALINGDMTEDAFIAGENVEAWVDAIKSGKTKELVGTTDGVPSTWDEAEILERMNAISNGFSPLLMQEMQGMGKPEHPSEFDDYMEAAADAIDRSGAFGAGAAESMQRWQTLMDSPYDDLMWSQETVGVYGYDPIAMLNGDTSQLDGRSPLDLVAPAEVAAQENWRVIAGKHAVCLEDGAFADASLLGLALHYAELGYSWEEAREDIRQELFKAVMLHEVGHTVGLRHNFAASFDAFNYAPEYWDLRDDGDMRPRHVDPESDAEINGRIREFQYSSVMDYGGSRNGDWHGLGHWDEAAVKFGYGELVEVMDGLPDTNAVGGLTNQDAVGFISAYNASNVYPTVLLWFGSGEMLQLHYTDYPGIAGDLESRVDVPLDRLAPTAEDGGYAGMLQVTEAVRGVVAAGAPAAPYKFCSDEFAVGMTCARFDEGADPYEVQQFTMQRYWNYYLLSNFQRDRYGFGDAQSYLNGLQGRIFGPLRTWQRYYALFHGIFGVDSDSYAEEYFAAERGFGGWTAATDESFRFLTQIVTRPEPGPHGHVYRSDGEGIYEPMFGAEVMDIPLIAGAYYESEWAYDSGYHWFDRQSRIGTYWDRMLALMALTTTESYGFIGYDTSADPRAYSIGYQDLYRDQIALFLGQLMSDDATALGPIYVDENLVYPDTVQLGRQWPPDGEKQVSPAAYWLVQYDAGLFGKALLARGYDRSFLNRSRIYIEGSGDAIDPPVDQGTVSFTDPGSGKTYTAWSFDAESDGEPVMSDGAPVELGSGARMLARANRLLDLCELTEIADYTDPLDDDSLAEQEQIACAELEKYASDLDLQLQLFDYFEDATE